jgi:hypothetical protein
MPSAPQFSGEVWTVLRRLASEEEASSHASTRSLGALDRAIRAVLDGQTLPSQSLGGQVTLEAPAQRAIVLGRELAQQRGAAEVELSDLVAAVSAVAERGS